MTLGSSQKAKLGKYCDPQGLFGVALARKRLRARLSQKELGVIFGVHRVTVARWETGVMIPRPKDIRRKDAMWLLDKLAGASDFERRKILIEKGIV